MSKDVLHNFLETIVTMIEYRSLGPGEHIRRIKELTKILVDHLKNDPKYASELAMSDSDTISQAASMHDVGKIGIPDHILLKPGRLTQEEFKIIESHTIIGSDMIAAMMGDKRDDYLKYCYEIARHHHERWDGKGYPDGLSGVDIPLSARIVTLVDVYDALVSPRVYKVAMTHEDTMAIISREAGTHFDGEIVRALSEIADKVRAVYNSPEASRYDSIF